MNSPNFFEQSIASMSYTEINSRNWGLPYGSLPYDRLLEKLEETDPDLVSEVRGYDELHELENEYPDYVRSEIIDWTPDAPYLESDHPRRDPAWSRSMLNLRYNGTRGSNPELPRHPELFYGFTGNDPRGAVNDPRFDEWRGHITSRAAELCVSMGDNADFHLAERPWTNQSISYDMKELQRRLKRNTKIFEVQKEGRPWGNNVIADEFAAGAIRAAGMGAGRESFATGGEGFYGAAPPRFAAGDHAPAVELFTDGARGLGALPEDAGTPWRHTTGDADLGVQQYGQKRGAGRGLVAPDAVGGGRARAGGADQSWEDSRRAQGTNRRALGATMALAARYRQSLGSGAHDQAPGASYEGYGVTGAGLAPARDVALLYRYTTEDQSRRPGTEVQDGDGGQLGGARGLTPAAHPELAARAVEAGVAPNAYLTNADAIVTGLREGTAAGRRRVAGLVVADGARNLAASEAAEPARRGVAPGADYGRLAHLASAPLARSAAASGLEVHAYRSAPPPGPEQRAALARGAYEGGTWRPHLEALPVGASKAPGEWRSATQGQSRLGDAPGQVFGPDADVAGYHGPAPVGPKSLRSGAWSDSAGLTDEFGGFDGA